MKPATLLLLLLVLVTPQIISAQSFHLPPAPRNPTEPMELLTIELQDTAEVSPGGDTSTTVQTETAGASTTPPVKSRTGGVAISITGGELLVYQDGEMSAFPLADLTVEKLGDLIESHKASMEVRVLEPELPAAWLTSRGVTTLDSGRIVLMGQKSNVSLGTGFGGVFAPGVDDGDDGNGLLAGAGVHFNVTGTANLGEWGWSLPSLLGLDHDFRVRLGFAVDEAVAVDQAEESTTSIDDLLEQATQVSASLAYDQHLGKGDFRPVLSFELSGAWNRFNVNEFAIADSMLIANSMVDVSAEADDIRDYFGRVEPTSTLGVTLLMVGYGDREYSFYGGMGLLWHQVLVRGLRSNLPQFEAQEDERCFVHTCASLTGDERGLWRAAVGANLGGLFDLRLDAVGGFDRAALDPLIRILLIKPFTVSGPG